MDTDSRLSIVEGKLVMLHTRPVDVSENTDTWSVQVQVHVLKCFKVIAITSYV